MSDEDAENTWKDVESTKTLTYFNWYRGQPDGGTSENCAYMYPGDGEWHDLDAQTQCSLCAQKMVWH